MPVQNMAWQWGPDPPTISAARTGNRRSSGPSFLIHGKKAGVVAAVLLFGVWGRLATLGGTGARSISFAGIPGPKHEAGCDKCICAYNKKDTLHLPLVDKAKAAPWLEYGQKGHEKQGDWQ